MVAWWPWLHLAAVVTPSDNSSTSTNVTLSNGTTINATIVTVNNTALLSNETALPTEVDVPTIVRLDSTVATNVSDPIFISLDTNSSVAAAAAAPLTLPSKPYLYTGQSGAVTTSYTERTVWFFINVLRMNTTLYVKQFAGATPSYNPIAGSCAVRQPSVDPVYWGVSLQAATASHVTDMRVNNCFQHNTCNATLCGLYGSCSFASRIAYFYKKPLLAGENVAVGFQSAVAVINAYVNSPGHCSNIMYPGFQEVGSSQQGVWWGNDFGGGPADTASRIVMAHHLINSDKSVTFFSVLNFVPKFVPMVCFNDGSRCQSMARLDARIHSYTLSAKDAAAMAPKCGSYIVYVYSIDSYVKFPQQGSLAMTNNQGCTSSFLS